MNIVVLTPSEEFIEFINPDLLDLTEKISKQGLRAISVEYSIKNIVNAKKLFAMGNKLWVSGDDEIKPCLYVINTKMEENIFQANTFKFDAEEVLVELNHAPLFSQTDLIRDNGFTISYINNETVITIDWNALNYWFGAFFNIGVVQECLSEYVAKVPLSGSMTLMSLLRLIEDETGNYFVTRYEKDLNKNIIHRYLDFLNPHDSSKDWVFNIEYDALDVDNTCLAYENNNNVVAEDEVASTETDPPVFKPNWEADNVNAYMGIRITKDTNILYDFADTIPSLANYKHAIINLQSIGGDVSLRVLEKNFPPLESDTNVGGYQNGYLNELVGAAYGGANTVSEDIKSKNFFAQTITESGSGVSWDLLSRLKSYHPPSYQKPAQCGDDSHRLNNTVPKVLLFSNFLNTLPLDATIKTIYVQYYHIRKPYNDDYPTVAAPEISIGEMENGSLNVWETKTGYSPGKSWSGGNQLTFDVSSRNLTTADVADLGVRLVYPSVTGSGWIFLDYCRVVFEYNSPVYSSGVDISNFEDSNLELYDKRNNRVLFTTKIHSVFSTVQEDILDLGYNVENIKFETDETDTYTAISPVFKLSDNGNLSRTDLNNIITRWLNLEVQKGDIIPLIVQKVNITGTETTPCLKRKGTPEGGTSAEALLGEYSVSGNYWRKPVKPSDNTEDENRTYEYWRATAYYRAPFTKYKGDMHVKLENVQEIGYQNILARSDIRDERFQQLYYQKMGTTDTADEDPYAIFNQVCSYLKDHQYPELDITVDVANLKDKHYNNYNLHDKVYVRLPGSQELVTAEVDSTEKHLHNKNQNKLTLANYSLTTKVLPTETYISAKNLSFKYPNSKTLKATLLDESDNPLKKKLLTFTVYKIDGGTSEWTGKVYSKKTKSDGTATITLTQLLFKPGDYEIEINFGGDGGYAETSLTIEVNVSGKISVLEQSVAEALYAKEEAETTGQTVVKKQYWSKCGLSPDKKKIVSIAKPSGTDANRYSYKLYETVFKNYCPICKKWGGLRFDGGSKNKCITSQGARGRGYKVGVPEHEITCNYCDSDYCGVTGIEKWSPSRGRLSVVKKPKASSNADFNRLVTGKLLYGKVKTVENKVKTTNNSYNNHQSGINKQVKQKAISVASGTTGLTALKKIAAFMGDSINYGYDVNFNKTPIQVLNSRRGNCCSQTRLMLQMMDVVDTNNEFDLYYVHVCCHPTKGVGHVFAKVVTRSTGKWRYVDPCKDNPWGNYVHGWGSPPGSQKKYPTLPF